MDAFADTAALFGAKSFHWWLVEVRRLTWSFKKVGCTFSVGRFSCFDFLVRRF